MDAGRLRRADPGGRERVRTAGIEPPLSSRTFPPLGRPLVYLHAHAPPTPGGTPVLLHRLLSGLAADELEVVTDAALRGAVREGGPRVFRAPYHFVLRKGARGNRYAIGRLLNTVINAVLAGVAGIRAAAVARKRQAGWILTVSDEGFSVIAGAICGRLTRLPHIVMVFDLWEENAYTGIARAFARLLEPRILGGAARVVVHNPQMAEHYQAKYGISCTVLPTSVELWQPPASRARQGSTREILFAGAVYWAQEDALSRLSRATRGLEGTRLTLLGPRADEAHLRAHGIVVDRIEADLPPDQFRTRLDQADVLFLGLGFDTAHPEVIRTASPAKLPEYMASGRPMVIHAPPDSYVARYATEYDFAEVVTVPDDETLRTALIRVLQDEPLGAERVARAEKIAREHHEATLVRERFYRLLESLVAYALDRPTTGEG